MVQPALTELGVFIVGVRRGRLVYCVILMTRVLRTPAMLTLSVIQVPSTVPIRVAAHLDTRVWTAPKTSTSANKVSNHIF
ncbi:unnamed protein product [Acanthoscelides obtectus]|uniref:Uncharacterized protein n=1 Tax=Acanthoscelides obtectus TaxID=200917 RepID=A0A9P0KZA3_ACAOB|nr:unnamed protein product [Acanthoscelides obtectus]CAK1653830.1 hypothetical protein AOBTE_LOCUS18377 [Acanthoscelides obtectus]